MENIFNSDVIIAGITIAVPILLAALGGMFCDQANLFNIALESFMLFGAFFSVVGSYFSSSPWIGLLCAGLAGAAIALIFAVLVVNGKADTIVVGTALNLAAWGATTVLLELIFKVRGFLMDSNVVSFPSLNIPVLAAIPVLGPILSGRNLLVYLTLILTIFVYIFTYRFKIGLRIRALGQNPEVLETAGLNIRKYRYIAILINGLLCGFAGASLTLGGLSIFSENMTAGKGFIALAAVLLAKGKPKYIILASIIFGIADAISSKMQGFGIPNQLVLMTPYIMTMIFLFVGAVKNYKTGVV